MKNGEMYSISEIEITPVRPNQGLVAFASFVIDGRFYVGNVAIYTRLDGGIRLVYPTRKVGTKNMPLFNPINRAAADWIEEAIYKEYVQLMGGEIL